MSEILNFPEGGRRMSDNPAPQKPFDLPTTTTEFIEDLNTSIETPPEVETIPEDMVLPMAIADNFNTTVDEGKDPRWKAPKDHKLFVRFPRKKKNNISVSPIEFPTDIISSDAFVDEETKQVLIPLTDEAEHWHGFEDIKADVVKHKKGIALSIGTAAVAGGALYFGYALKRHKK